jgi:hypothetical protein
MLPKNSPDTRGNLVLLKWVLERRDPMKPETDQIIDQLYDHLLAHPYFEATVRKQLNLAADVDVTENEQYYEALTSLVDETLSAMIVVNRSGTPGN